MRLTFIEPKMFSDRILQMLIDVFFSILWRALVTLRISEKVTTRSDLDQCMLKFTSILNKDISKFFHVNFKTSNQPKPADLRSKYSTCLSTSDKPSFNKNLKSFYRDSILALPTLGFYFSFTCIQYLQNYQNHLNLDSKKRTYKKLETKLKRSYKQIEGNR